MQWFWINASFLPRVQQYRCRRFHFPHTLCKHFLWVPYLWVCCCWNCIWSIYLNRFQNHKCNLTSDASFSFIFTAPFPHCWAKYEALPSELSQVFQPTSFSHRLPSPKNSIFHFLLDSQCLFALSMYRT